MTVNEGQALSFDTSEGKTYEVSGVAAWTQVSLACDSGAERLTQVSDLAMATTEGIRHTRET